MRVKVITRFRQICRHATGNSRCYGSHQGMKVRLTKKLAERIDGVDLSEYHVGEVLELSPRESRVLIAEEWATERERRRVQAELVGSERRRAQSEPLVDEQDTDHKQAW